MKKSLLTLSLVAVSAVAFGQGKLTFDNVGRPITLGSVVLAADAAFASKAVPVPNDSGVPLPSGRAIVAGLYVGATSGSEVLVTTVPVSTGGGVADGLYAAVNIALPVPGGVMAFFQVKYWESTFASYAAQGGTYAGYRGSTLEFTATPGTASFKSLSSSLATQSGSTWQAGGLTVDPVPAVPEPATFALAGLGAAALMIFRRRK